LECRPDPSPGQLGCGTAHPPRLTGGQQSGSRCGAPRRFFKPLGFCSDGGLRTRRAAKRRAPRLSLLNQNLPLPILMESRRSRPGPCDGAASSNAPSKPLTLGERAQNREAFPLHIPAPQHCRGEVHMPVDREPASPEMIYSRPLPSATNSPTGHIPLPVEDSRVRMC